MLIEMLILGGTDIDHFVDGLTALHFCILNNYKDYVKILIQYGASWHLENSKKQSAAKKLQEAHPNIAKKLGVG